MSRHVCEILYCTFANAMRSCGKTVNYLPSKVFLPVIIIVLYGTLDSAPHDVQYICLDLEKVSNRSHLTSFTLNNVRLLLFRAALLYI